MSSIGQIMERSEDIELRLLVTQLRDGNRHAFNALYRLHSKALLLNIRSLVKDNEDADEIFQDTFLKIWEIRSSLDPDRSYKGLLYKIAKNKVYNHFHKLALDEKRKVEMINSAVTGYAHVEEQLIHKEHELLLNKAIEQLSEQCRKVYMLSKIDGKSHQEISTLLSISMATVNNHLVKANRQIREFLSKNSEMSSLILPLFLTLFPWD